MADPRQEYAKQLENYGLGQGGLRSNIGSQRSPFAEEGPSAGGYSFEQELFPDDPLAGLTRDESMDLLTSMGIDPFNPSGAFSEISDRASRRPESVFPEIAPDVADFPDFAESYGEVMDALDAGPAGVSSGLSTDQILERLGANAEAFDLEGPEAVLDDIDETIASAALTPEEILMEQPLTPAKSTQDMTEEDVTSQTVIGQEEVEAGFKAAMDDYIQAVRGEGPSVKGAKDIEEYKRAFAEATGIDVSGKVDKSSALMAFGLALMQNKAGKGFNVGKMLSAVGKAGDAALPALEKAKAQARQGALAGGKYALEMRSADTAKAEAAREKAMDRGKYWVYKKGRAGADFEGFDQGEFVDLNKYELNKLIMNPDFEKEYEFVDASDRMSILEKRAEGVDLGDQWDPYDKVSLIGGNADDVPPELQVLAAPASSNYKGITPTQFKLAETPETVARRFMEYQTSINSGAEKFKGLIDNLNEGISIPKQILGGMQQALRNLGVDAGGMPSTVSDAKRMLTNLAIDEATNILKESGKTLSDTDRQLVKDRIGKISWASGDVELIKRQLNDIYDLTVLKPQRNLDRAVGWLEQNAGIKFDGNISDAPTQAELDAMNKIYGTNYTLDDYLK